MGGGKLSADAIVGIISVVLMVLLGIATIWITGRSRRRQEIGDSLETAAAADRNPKPTQYQRFSQTNHTTTVHVYLHPVSGVPMAENLDQTLPTPPSTNRSGSKPRPVALSYHGRLVSE